MCRPSHRFPFNLITLSFFLTAPRSVTPTSPTEPVGYYRTDLTTSTLEIAQKPKNSQASDGSSILLTRSKPFQGVSRSVPLPGNPVPYQSVSPDFR